MKRWKMVVGLAVLVPLLLFVAVTAGVYWKQDELVQQLIDTANQKFAGRVAIQDSHISPFTNFPYISIDLEGVALFETKTDSVPLVAVADVYLGFDVWSVVRGAPDVKAIRVREGTVKLIERTDGSFNLQRALAMTRTEAVEDGGGEFAIHLKSIAWDRVDVIKMREADSLMVEAFVERARAQFRSEGDLLHASLKSAFTLHVMDGPDTTFFNHKHFQLNTAVDFQKSTQWLTVLPSEVMLENALFSMKGTVDMSNEASVDISFDGEKTNFDLLMAFAPPELMPTLKRYENAGQIFFHARVVGKTLNGHMPHITADFGCENAFFNNTVSQRKLNDLFFKGHFTNGEARQLSSMEFSLLDISARPEAGVFKGYVKVKNFESPEIDMQVQSQFDLDFLADFLNVTGLQELKGSIALTMNFHDIVDLDNPEKSIERLNESYFTQLSVKGLSFRSPDFHLPVERLDLEAHMDGHRAVIDTVYMKVGESDVRLRATVSDLPAILHHTAQEVTADMTIQSARLNIRELTSGDTAHRQPFNEVVTNLAARLKFKASAKAFTESPYLPIGEFFIDDLYAKLQNYPHTLHDFHADVYIEREDFRVIDFTGVLDESDFHFSGRLKHYDLWMQEQPKGHTHIDFDLTSRLLQLKDLFAYGGENYVPVDYRHEEFRDTQLKGRADFYFNHGLQSVDLFIDRLEGRMRVHPLKAEGFKGRFHYEKDHLLVEDFSGTLGQSTLAVNAQYYLGPDSTLRQKDNFFSLKSPRLNFDELFHRPAAAATQGSAPSADSAFNIYTLPFTHMAVALDIAHLNYHRYLIHDFRARLRTTPEHYLYVDTLSLRAAGGTIGLTGYFNGSNPKKIYFSPQMRLRHVDLDQLLFKFENFGQDHVVSENLHGKLTAFITGHVRMHTDLVPVLDDSELHMDVQVVGGRLDNYTALEALSDYFGDKNLRRVQFDTLRNRLDLKDGTLSIPAMTINSTLGFIEIAGTQDLNQNMEYFVRVPWRLVTQAASQKLFGRKTEEVDPDQVDVIQYRDQHRNARFLNLKITGKGSDFSVSLGKKRDSR
ncbi:MAG: membrane biogenesis protein [Cyclobacteriaceae bacterium]|nr:membrane biogenesis protein [Cyclobacteriaceae bacterium]